MEKHSRLFGKTNENFSNGIVKNPQLEEGESNLIAVEKNEDETVLHHEKQMLYKGSLEHLSFDNE